MNFDENMFYLDADNNLRLQEGFKGKVILPEECTSCHRMFKGCDLTGVDFTEFDTSNVKDMSDMFAYCKLPDGFKLGDKFDTSNVKDMCNMFCCCKFPEGFALGDKFDTSNVKDMSYMFAHCKLPEGSTLGDKFDTSNVRNMSMMFYKCVFSVGFTLGDKFDTSNVKEMCSMFSECELPEGFTLGDKFDTSNVEDMYRMFSGCTLPGGLVGEKYNLSAVIEYLNSKQPTQQNQNIKYHNIVTYCKQMQITPEDFKKDSERLMNTLGVSSMEELNVAIVLLLK